MASTRMAFGAIMGTITNTASAVSDLADTAGSAVGMLNSFVQSASQDQKERQVLHRGIFRQELLKEGKLTIAKSNEEVLKFCAESAENKMLYEQASNYVDGLFADFDGKKS